MGIFPPDEVNPSTLLRQLRVFARSLGGHGEHPFSRFRGGVMENPRPEKVAVVDEVREKLATADCRRS
jgi:hypothetical protein